MCVCMCVRLSLSPSLSVYVSVCHYAVTTSFGAHRIGMCSERCDDATASPAAPVLNDDDETQSG